MGPDLSGRVRAVSAQQSVKLPLRAAHGGGAPATGDPQARRRAQAQQSGYQQPQRPDRGKTQQYAQRREQQPVRRSAGPSGQAAFELRCPAAILFRRCEERLVRLRVPEGVPAQRGPQRLRLALPAEDLALHLQQLLLQAQLSLFPGGKAGPAGQLGIIVHQLPFPGGELIQLRAETLGLAALCAQLPQLVLRLGAQALVPVSVLPLPALESGGRLTVGDPLLSGGDRRGEPFLQLLSLADR